MRVETYQGGTDKPRLLDARVMPDPVVEPDPRDVKLSVLEKRLADLEELSEKRLAAIEKKLENDPGPRP